MQKLLDGWPNSFLVIPDFRLSERRCLMRKRDYLRYRRLITVSKEVLRLIMMILAIVIVIKSI